jgi:hypothetical protein
MSALLLRAPVCRRNGNAKQTIPTEAHSWIIEIVILALLRLWLSREHIQKRVVSHE